MAGKSTSRPMMKAEPMTVFPQMWALNPMASMVGMAGWSEIMKEGAQFISERVRKDMQVQRETLNCRSLDDVLRLQSEYYRDAAEHYARQCQRLAELLSEAAASGWIEATARRAREYDDIPV